MSKIGIFLGQVLEISFSDKYEKFLVWKIVFPGNYEKLFLFWEVLFRQV